MSSRHAFSSHTHAHARRVTHRTAFAANNYVGDFSVAILRPPLPLLSRRLSLPFPLSLSSSLSFRSLASSPPRVSLQPQRTGLASFERRGDSLRALACPPARSSPRESSFPALRDEKIGTHIVGLVRNRKTEGRFYPALVNETLSGMGARIARARVLLSTRI